MPTLDDELNLISGQTQIDNELYDNESHIVHPILSIRREALPQKGEDWEICENNKVVFTIKGIKLTKKQRKFLYTPKGLNTIIAIYREGNFSMNKIKKEINNKIND